MDAQPAPPVRTFPTRERPGLGIDPLLEEIRDEGRAARVTLPHGEPCWVVAGYDDVRTVYADPRFRREGTTTEAAPRTTSIVLVRPGTLNSLDGVEHTRLRRA
ncbi:MAG TPA: hypothetical protein VF743_03685, partial [Acidimicrobiales bacterium]